jgi:hypothetical protein
MKLFIVGKIYKLTLEFQGEISYYTAEILEEDELNVKFKDKKGKILTKQKELIKSSEEIQ